MKQTSVCTDDIPRFIFRRRHLAFITACLLRIGMLPVGCRRDFQSRYLKPFEFDADLQMPSDGLAAQAQTACFTA